MSFVPLGRRTVIGAAGCLAVSAFPTLAQARTVLRISSPAVPDDWHAKMWTVFKDSLDKSTPGGFDVQINLNGSLFKQGTEPTAMARGNLELAAISAFDIAGAGVFGVYRGLHAARPGTSAKGVQRTDRRGVV